MDKANTDISFFGGADVGSKFPDGRIERVLLLPPKDIYLNRLKKRDSENPEKLKQAQRGEIIYEDFTLWAEAGVGHYHQIIREDLTPEETLDQIIKNLKKKKASKKIIDCEFDYWIVLIYVCIDKNPEIALFKCGPFWTSYHSNTTENGFEGIRKLISEELGISKEDCYPGRFIDGAKDLIFPWDRSTVVWTSVVRLKDKALLKPTSSRFSEFKWFSKEDVLNKLDGNKFSYAFLNEFSRDTFWECLES